MGKELLTVTERGIYCEAGDFFIDPWRPVDRAIVTHAHSDHARWGMERYLCSDESLLVMRRRLGDEAKIDSVPYGEVLTWNGVKVSLHPAGHILGSAQVRVEHNGQVAVVSGDYKTEADTTCTPFEPIKCHLFVSESTFGLPIYRWSPQEEVYADVNAWWRSNQAQGKASLLLGYALGKSQRALSGLNPEIGPIFLHGAVQGLTEDYRAQGVQLPPTKVIGEAEGKFDWSQAMILAPPSANGTPWVRRFGDHSTAFLSGWMAIRGARRRRAVDRGFVLSDHVDWPSLLSAIKATEAERVWVTHGYSATVVRYLQEQGLDAKVLETEFEGEQDDAAVEEVSE
ncbi:MAG: ligase-associated DNA damage response exonuclease [Chlorobia bacterium]|nr:ligase-associated DNA damage response exonuclease [Fimbriimonadaceae bacterium]